MEEGRPLLSIGLTEIIENFTPVYISLIAFFLLFLGVENAKI